MKCSGMDLRTHEYILVELPGILHTNTDSNLQNENHTRAPSCSLKYLMLLSRCARICSKLISSLSSCIQLVICSLDSKSCPSIIPRHAEMIDLSASEKVSVTL